MNIWYNIVRMEAAMRQTRIVTKEEDNVAKYKKQRFEIHIERIIALIIGIILIIVSRFI